MNNEAAAILVNDASLDINSVNARTVLDDLASGLDAAGRPDVAVRVRRITLGARGAGADVARNSLRVIAARLVA